MVYSHKLGTANYKFPKANSIYSTEHFSFMLPCWHTCDRAQIKHEFVPVVISISNHNRLLCRLNRSKSELPSSTGVTSFIRKLSFPSSPPAVSSPLSPAVMSLVAIAVSAEMSPATADFLGKEVISEKRQQANLDSAQL